MPRADRQTVVNKPSHPTVSRNLSRDLGRPLGALILLTALAMPLAIVMVFFYAPRERALGDIQRIFYFHVASAWVGFGAFLITALAGAAYLASGNARFDLLGAASAEVGLAFIAMTVATGSLWARPVWGTYWTWEPRLTISAIQLFTYVALLMLRASMPDTRQRARSSAVYSIFAFATVPLSWFAIRWWRTIHPNILSSANGMAITPPMRHTLVSSLVAFTLLYLTLLAQRFRLAVTSGRLINLEAQLERLRRRRGQKGSMARRGPVAAAQQHAQELGGD